MSMVLNVEPNTTENFITDTIDAAPSGTLNLALRLQRRRRSRGHERRPRLRLNFHYDAAGRLLAEDYSPAKRPCPLLGDCPTSAAPTRRRSALPSTTLTDPEWHSSKTPPYPPLPRQHIPTLGAAPSPSSTGPRPKIHRDYDARGRVKSSALASPTLAPTALSPSTATRLAGTSRKPMTYDAADREIASAPRRLESGPTLEQDLLGSRRPRA